MVIYREMKFETSPFSHHTVSKLKLKMFISYFISVVLAQPANIVLLPANSFNIEFHCADGLKIIPRGAVQGLDLNHPRIFGPKSISFVSQNNINSAEFAMCPTIPKGFKVGNVVNGNLNNILGPQTIAIMSGIGYYLRRNPVFPAFELSSTFGTDNYNPREIIAAR